MGLTIGIFIIAFIFVGFMVWQHCVEGPGLQDLAGMYEEVGNDARSFVPSFASEENVLSTPLNQQGHVVHAADLEEQRYVTMQERVTMQAGGGGLANAV